MGVERFLVASPTNGVQAQRLVRRVCSHCAEPIDEPTLAMELVHAATAHQLGDQWVRAVGCDACQHTGYRGRMGIYELVPITTELQDMIVSGTPLVELKRFAHDEQGHRTLLQDGLLKASQGRTTVEEVLRQTVAGVEDS